MTSAPPPPDSSRVPHASVLLREVLAALDPAPGDVIVDATLGAGGHTEALLEGTAARVIGVDRDDTALAIAGRRLAAFGDRVTFVKGRFSDLEAILAERGVTAVAGVLADVGVSSMQIDNAGRGMSFRHDGPLDMRMDTSEGETARDLIERLDDDELADVLYKLGEERRSRRIARCIKLSAAEGRLETTHDLRRAVVRAVGPARVGGIDPATKTFQALRIAVNAELEELEALLAAAPRVLRPGGVLAIISFHSLEDRLAKHAMRDRDVWQPLTKKPVVAQAQEVFENPRARSAKLRAARRLGEGPEAWGAPEFDGYDGDGDEGEGA